MAAWGTVAGCSWSKLASSNLAKDYLACLPRDWGEASPPRLAGPLMGTASVYRNSLKSRQRGDTEDWEWHRRAIRHTGDWHLFKKTWEWEEKVERRDLSNSLQRTEVEKTGWIFGQKQIAGWMLFWGRWKEKVIGESICKLSQGAGSGGGYSFSPLTTNSSFSGAVAQKGCKRRREANACYCFTSSLNLRHSRRICIRIFLIKKFSLESFKPIWEPVYRWMTF